ncbi:disease resistance protein RPV1-like [Rosa rugosa]|uniref:disease resistance protein RPV1-like n=1 Tax=Rosa rugosa TaxID=74645 RepID=UPI002B4109F2|nr:disease resistance protein RPV1-like [Rosa rugosa]
MASSSASSSSDIPPKEKYDVFLSFRGTDTRKTFTSHLYKALDDKKIDTYIDYNLERGEEIAPALLKAIERSKISVIVFSENYASSRWCLDELVHILECREKYGQHVIPIFYKTVVSDIRHQRGGYELEEHFKDRTESERLKWKVALTKAANLSGFESTSTRDDSELIHQVVQFILTNLSYESSSYELDGFVGVGSRVQQVESLLCIVPRDDRVRSVVIWGMGGIGKTTLADAVFHRLSSQFDACCFLADVREGSGTQKELKDLRNRLLRTLLGDKTLDIQSKTIDRSTAVKLSRKRVLVVLDDVDKSSQLEMLAGRDVTFGSGSRIIITTRDDQRVRDIEVLRGGGNHDVKIYEVEKLSDDEARQIFNLNASTGIYSDVHSTYFLTRMIAHAAGIPLALKHWSSLSHKLSWDEMTKIINEKMGSIYRVSYDVLRKNEKEIFLDIACFHKGKQINHVRGHLDCRSLPVDSGIGDLIDRSLIELRGSYLWMHDVIQEMGREIVREKCPEEPGNRTRLYTLKDIRHVLQNDTGTATIETMSTVVITYDRTFKLSLTRQVFGKMYNLTFLDLDGFFDYYTLQLPQGLESLPNVLRYLSWKGYPLGTLPSKFSPSCLVELHMRNSKLQTVWNTDQKPQHLKKIDLSYSRELVDVPYLTACLESINLEGCKSLVEVPNLSKSLNIASINLQGCKKLVEVPSYFENLHKLTVLNLSGCGLLKRIPEMPSNLEFLLISGNREKQPDCDSMRLSGLPSSIWSLKKLVKLDLSYCYYIENLPSSIWTLNSLTSLDLSYTSIEGLPSSIECLSRVISINLKKCHRLVSLSTSICKLKYLEILDLSHCSSFESFPEILEPMECLKTLHLSNTKIEELHDSIEKLVGLEELNLFMCKSFKSLSNSIYKLRFLKYFRVVCCSELKKLPISSSDILWSLISELDFGGCTSLEEIPDGLMKCLTSLKKLDFSETKIKSIPTSIKELSGLRSLRICNCQNLESLPELPYNLESLDADDCRNLEMVSFSMTAVTQGLDQICYKDVFKRRVKYSFRNCKKLSETAKSNMMNDAELGILRTAFSKREEKDPDRYYSPRREDYSVAIVYTGNEIPERFRYQTEGSSINIKLPVHPSHTNTNLWQFVLCAVLTFDNEDSVSSSSGSQRNVIKACREFCFTTENRDSCALDVDLPLPDNYDEDEDDDDTLWRSRPDCMKPRCKFNFTTNNGDSSPLDFTLPLPDNYDEEKGINWDDKSQVFVWYCAYWSTHVRSASEASFNFYLRPKWALGKESDTFPKERKLIPYLRVCDGIKVKRCGVCLLSSEGQDVKFVGVNQDVGEPKPEQVISTKRSRDQYEASGSATVALSD